MTLGIALNPYATNVSTELTAAARRLAVPVRMIHLPTLRLRLPERGEPQAMDRAGPVQVTALAPYLLFGFPAAVHALRRVGRRAYAQNPVDAVLLADDKAAAAERLVTASVPQLETVVCGLDVGEAGEAAEQVGYPVVVKRTHGAQGQWVRRAADATALERVLKELTVEGAGALIVQPQVVEAFGRAVRAIATGGRVLAVTERIAGPGEWRSNVAAGAGQHRIELTSEEHRMVTVAVAALGLRHAGVDLLRTARGPRVLEVNACPDFTSMRPYFEQDLGALVVAASLGGSRSGSGA